MGFVQGISSYQLLGSGLRICTGDRAGKNSDHLEDLATLDEGRVFPFGKSAVCSRLLSVTVCAVLVAFVWLKSITPIENSSLVRNNCFAQTFPLGQIKVLLNLLRRIFQVSKIKSLF